jgi:hypothetical protein
VRVHAHALSRISRCIVNGGEFPKCGETSDVIQVMKPKSKVRN